VFRADANRFSLLNRVEATIKIGSYNQSDSNAVSFDSTQIYLQPVTTMPTWLVDQTTLLVESQINPALLQLAEEEFHKAIQKCKATFPSIAFS
jgi:hypothetical protein